MSDQKSSRMRVYFTALVLLAELAHLAWEHFNGGIRIHHVLQRADLPAISNAWGVILLPALTWFFSGRIYKRAAFRSNNQSASSAIPFSVIAGFVTALTFGVSLSVAFTYDFTDISSYLFFGALIIAMFLPVYRAECVLGFILGMTFTFGAVLPTVIGTMIAAISAFFGFCVHPVLGWLVNLFKRTRAKAS